MRLLGDSALTGVPIGRARIDALSTPAAGRQIAVTPSSAFGQPFRVVNFPAAQITNVVVATGAGRNTVSALRLDLPGELRITSGPGNDTVLVSETIAATFSLDTGDGADLANLSSDVVVTTAVDLGAGRDVGTFQGSLFTGSRAVRGGSGFDIANLFRTDLTREALTGFEVVQG